MISFVTVTFREEIPILSCQAQSMDLYVDSEQVDAIYVVLNDENSVIHNIDKKWWGRHHDKVILLSRDVFDIQIAQHHGWLLQQILKLKIAALSESRWSVILDSKTLFINPVFVKHMFDHKARPYTSTMPKNDFFHDSINICTELFGHEVIAMPGPGEVPFLINNRSCQDLLSHLENVFQMPFSEWFLSRPQLTEFVLYTAWILKTCDGSLELMYNLQDLYFKTVNVSAEGPCDFAWIFQKMLRPELKTVSVHRNRWKNFNSFEKQLYLDFLISRGISRCVNLSC